MTNSNYRLLPPKDEYVQVSIYLNRVHLDGYTPVKRSYPVGNRAIGLQEDTAVPFPVGRSRNNRN